MKLQPKYKTEIIPVIFIVSGIIAVVLRLYFNFSTSLIPGINGAYYPLQVRHVITSYSIHYTKLYEISQSEEYSKYENFLKEEYSKLTDYSDISLSIYAKTASYNFV